MVDSLLLGELLFKFLGPAFMMASNQKDDNRHDNY